MEQISFLENPIALEGCHSREDAERRARSLLNESLIPVRPMYCMGCWKEVEGEHHEADNTLERSYRKCPKCGLKYYD